MLHKSPADGIWSKYDVLFVSISEVGHFQRPHDGGHRVL